MENCEKQIDLHSYYILTIFFNFCRDKTDERSSFSHLSEKINIDYN